MARRPLVVGAGVVALGVLAGCGGDGGGDGGDAKPPIEGAPTIEVSGDNLAFDPDEITVDAGDFNVALTSEDIFHTFVIEDVDGEIEAGGNETTRGGYTIDDPGEYEFYCSVPGHREGGMEGTLIVE